MDGNIFLCFQGLMESVRESSSRHDTSGKTVYNPYLIITYHVIFIFMHQIVCAKSHIHAMLNADIFRIGQILDAKEFFCLFRSLLR